MPGGRAVGRAAGGFLKKMVGKLIRPTEKLVARDGARVVGRDAARAVERDAAKTAERDATKAALNDADRAALKDYTGDGFREINDFLRNPGKYSGDEAKALQQRADAVSEALHKLPERPGMTYRGVEYSDDILGRYRVGEDVTEDAFTSTSKDVSVADGNFDGNTLMIVEGRSGRDVAAHSEYGNESEVLYDKSTRFRVTAKDWDPVQGKWIIRMREV